MNRSAAGPIVAPAQKSSFFVAFRVLPPERREAITAVYGFCRRADDAVDLTPDPAQARRRLDGVARELDRLFDGGSDAGSDPLARAIRRFDLPRRPFDDLIEGCAWDIENRRYQDIEDLRQYCYRVASTVGLLCVRIFGCERDTCDAYAMELGVALQWTNILRDIGVDSRRGRTYLPRAALERNHLLDSALHCLDEQARSRLDVLIRDECHYVKRCFAKAERLCPQSERPKLLAAEIMGGVYRDLLRRIEKAGARVVDRRIRVPTPRRAWIAIVLAARWRLGGWAAR